MPTFSIRMDDMLCSRMSQLSPRKIQFFTSSECSGRPLARSLAHSLEGPRPLRLLDGRRQTRTAYFLYGQFFIAPRSAGVSESPPTRWRRQ